MRPIRAKTGPEFWVSNISGRKDVTIGDLRVKIPLGRTVNLMDQRHYHFTLKQLQKSHESGSLKLKEEGKEIKVRPGEPQKQPTMVLQVERNPRVLKPLRTKVDVTDEPYEELDFEETTESENEFAEEMADADFQERAPALAVDQRYINSAKHRVAAQTAAEAAKRSPKKRTE